MDSNTASNLTDGTGVSPQTLTKLIKDFVADALLSGAAALAAVGIVGIPTDEGTFWIALTAVGTGVFKALYRTVLRWATTP